MNKVKNCITCGNAKVYDSKPIRPEGREHMRRARALSCKE